METGDLTESQRERMEAIRAKLSDAAGAYATVTAADVMEYLLDLADHVDDPDPQGDEWPSPTSEGPRSFPRDALREQLSERNRKHGDESDHEEMDLYTIAAAYDVTGRSSMTKEELVDAVLDAAERRYRDPFAPVDVEFPVDGGGETASEGDEKHDPAGAGDESGDANETDGTGSGTDGDTEDTSATDVDDDADDGGDADEGGDTDAERGDATEANGDDGGSDQLDAMLSLLETHDDKWRETDGDARYEVELPDGSVRTARTKDDVRALLFKNY